MKKILLSLVALLCVASVSAQSKFESSVKSAAKAVASQKWSVGLRVGSGLQADAECFYSDKAYVEARFGMQYVNGLSADFTILHNWNCCNWNWTPNAGSWFLDAGVGANVGGKANYAYVGVAGQAKFGIKFKAAPVRLSLDWTPSVGPAILYISGEGAGAWYNTWALCNVGISATYCF